MSDTPIATIREVVPALKDSIRRNELFAGLYIVGCANGIVGRIYSTVYSTLNFDTWTGVVLSLDTNVIVLFACFAGVSALLHSSRDQIRSADLAVAAVFLIFVLFQFLR